LIFGKAGALTAAFKEPTLKKKLKPDENS